MKFDDLPIPCVFDVPADMDPASLYTHEIYSLMPDGTVTADGMRPMSADDAAKWFYGCECRPIIYNADYEAKS